jgi:hypothetical protein
MYCIPDSYDKRSFSVRIRWLEGKEGTTQAVKTTPHINKEKEPLWYQVP